MSLTKLKKFTKARIGLEQSGSSTKTYELLRLKEDLAKARDAVMNSWDSKALEKELNHQGHRTLALKTRVDSRALYLQRPDLGRSLSPCSERILEKFKNLDSHDIVIIISDGLSAHAIDRHFLPLWHAFLSLSMRSDFKLGPLCLVPFARVALSDEVGRLLKAKLTLMIIGERPGLSAIDSLGIYLTYNPRVGASDADRNCISNIHPPDGLSYELAVDKLWYLITMSFKLKISGVSLKEGDANYLKRIGKA